MLWYCRLGWKEHELEPVDRNVLPLDISGEKSLHLFPSLKMLCLVLTREDEAMRLNSSRKRYSQGYPLKLF